MPPFRLRGINMRLFYAVEFDEKTKDVLIARQSILKSNSVKANFTRRENLHLTLRFMGELAHADFTELQKIQDLVSKRHSPFELEISNIGVFERGQKSIVWAGIKENQNLLQLQRDLEKEITVNGFRPENRPYKPHITLAREFIPKGNIYKTIKEAGVLQHKFNIISISLMESTRMNGKLTYLCRYRTELCKAS